MFQSRYPLKTLGLLITSGALLAACGLSSTDSLEPLPDGESFSDPSLRQFPYPYDAMLAISTDIDATAYHDFKETHRYMNTKEETSMGTGLGLDIANSFWMYVDTDKEGKIDARESTTWREQMSYFNTDWETPFLAEEIRTYIEGGWIDTLHSYGDFSQADRETANFERKHAKAAIEELEEHDIEIQVWTNHGNQANIQNFGGSYSFTDYQEGDTPDTDGYHTDLIVPYGVEFLWDSNGHAEIGHDSVLYPIELQDGQSIWGFKRFTHIYTDEEKDWLWGAHDLNRQLSEDRLDSLVEEGHYSVIAQHLGNIIEDEAFPDQTVEALTRLRDYQENEDILVARTSRLLEYNRNHDYLSYSTETTDTYKDIHIHEVEDPVHGTFTPELDQLRGFTFEVSHPERTRLYLDGERISKEELTTEESGMIGITWFEPDYTDYTEKIH